MTDADRYTNRLREKVRAADAALQTVQAHVAARDPQTATWLTEVRERLDALAPEPADDDEPAAGPRF